MARNISFTVKYWKQDGPTAQGHFDIGPEPRQTSVSHKTRCSLEDMSSVQYRESVHAGHDLVRSLQEVIQSSF